MALDVLIADVSGWQSEDVSSLAGLGFKAVIPKYTEDLSSGSGLKAHAQCASARAAGMSVFAGYDFGLGSDGAAQCDALLDAFGSDNIQRAVLDAEVAQVSADIVLSFGQRAREWNPAVKPLLYGSTSFLSSMYGGVGEIANLFDGWIAAYTGGYDVITAPETPPPGPPAPFGSYLGWQFTSQFPTPIGTIDASVFDSAVFAADQPVPAQLGQNGVSSMIVNEVNDGGTTIQWWHVEGGVWAKIDQGSAFTLATRGVPWIKDVNTLTVISWSVAHAQGVIRLNKLVANPDIIAAA